MVEVKLDEKYVLMSDEFYWRLVVKLKNKKGILNKAVGYYSTLGSLFEHYYEIRLRESKVAGNLTELIQAVNSLKAEVTSLKERLSLEQPSRKPRSGSK